MCECASYSHGDQYVCEACASELKDKLDELSRLREFEAAVRVAMHGPDRNLDVLAKIAEAITRLDDGRKVKSSENV